MAGSAAGEPTEELLDQSTLPQQSEKPEVRVIATGGTIASTEGAAEEGGYSLSEQAEAIVEAVPALDYFVDITYEQVAQKGSSSLLVEDYVAVAEAAMAAEAEGVDGVLVTHGTDAIEEDAYFNDLVLDLDIPVAFVGAQRAADATSADGPKNLLTAVRMITRREFHLDEEPSGVYLVMNETIHAARDVTKGHTIQVQSFTSGPAGPIGIFTDNELVLYRDPGSYSSNIATENLDAASEMTVPIAATGAGAEAYMIEQAVAGAYDVDGIVIQATGWWGGTAPEVSDATEAALEAGIPVGRTTRVHWGPMNPGYDEDREGDIVVMEDLPSWKGRLHMIAALTLTEGSSTSEEPLEVVRQTVDEGKYGTRVTAPSTIETN
ncbi:asparaginase [Halovenus amylolytica]|uniref:asparaginase n=1 Tax=Halovenus amylolytica TaxID=2500550 RepID=UPI003D6A460C